MSASDRTAIAENEPAGLRTSLPPSFEPTGARSIAGRLLRSARRYPLVTTFGSMLIALVLLAMFAPWLSPYAPSQTNPEIALQSPSAAHWLGTDQLGRDTLTRVLYGLRVSLQVGIISVVLGAAVGIALGLLAGYAGGLVDQIISRYIDAQLAFPGLLLGIAITSALGASLTHAMLAVGILGIPRFMRFTRGQVLRVRELEFITAAQATGASRTRIVLRHVLPNIADPLIVVGSLAAGGAILAEAALSFLGLGAQPPTPDLGSMINVAKGYLENQAWLAVGPGVAIFLIVWSFANLGDALRDALDPRLKER
jgi:peptide/nickel transport system permease protein